MQSAEYNELQIEIEHQEQRLDRRIQALEQVLAITVATLCRRDNGLYPALENALEGYIGMTLSHPKRGLDEHAEPGDTVVERVEYLARMIAHLAPPDTP